MSPPDHLAEALPAKQTRSAHTVERLLDAAEAVLSEGGPDGTSIPAIARRARLSVGSVYRRFPDKEALIRAVYERLCERHESDLGRAVDPQYWENISIADMARTLIRNLVVQQHRNRKLRQGLAAYAESGANEPLRRRIAALNAESGRRLATLLLTRRAQIGHPDPDRAVPFALHMVGSTLRRSSDYVESLSAGPGISEADIGDELTRMFLGYLDVTVKPTPRPAFLR